MRRLDITSSVHRFIRHHGATTKAELVRSLFGINEKQIHKSLEQMAAKGDLLVNNGLYDLPVSRLAIALRSQIWNGGLFVNEAYEMEVLVDDYENRELLEAS